MWIGMRDFRLAAVLGLGIWVVVFVVQTGGVFESQSSVDTYSAAIGVFLTLVAAFYYFQDGGRGLLVEGVQVGFVWLVISLALDFVFLVPRWNIGLYDYLMTVGVGYVSMPVIAGLVGFSKEMRKPSK